MRLHFYRKRRMLYLVQHAEAKNADEDPQRDLSEVGVGHARDAGRFLSERGIRPQRIWHSGKRRAEHTAQIIAEEIRGVEILVHEDLSPNDDPGRVARELHETGESEVMIVGHLPYLDRLAALLLEVPSGQSPVRFRNAGVIALRRAEGAWVVEWAVPPQMMRKEPRDR